MHNYTHTFMHAPSAAVAWMRLSPVGGVRANSSVRGTPRGRRKRGSWCGASERRPRPERMTARYDRRAACRAGEAEGVGKMRWLFEYACVCGADYRGDGGDARWRVAHSYTNVHTYLRRAARPRVEKRRGRFTKAWVMRGCRPWAARLKGLAL